MNRLQALSCGALMIAGRGAKKFCSLECRKADGLTKTTSPTTKNADPPLGATSRKSGKAQHGMRKPRDPHHSRNNHAGSFFRRGMRRLEFFGLFWADHRRCSYRSSDRIDWDPPHFRVWTFGNVSIRLQCGLLQKSSAQEAGRGFHSVLIPVFAPEFLYIRIQTSLRGVVFSGFNRPPPNLQNRFQ